MRAIETQKESGKPVTAKDEARNGNGGAISQGGAPGNPRQEHPEDDKSAPPIRLSKLKKTFGKQTVLKGIDLEVKHGETVTVLGRSGTGKSVLLKLIVGLQKPDSGSICIFGNDVAGMGLDELNKVRIRMGFLFQYSALYDSLTVEQNVEFPLRRHTNMGRPERKTRVKELLGSVGMEKDLKKLPGEISGGMQKRVALARALALDPEILLFDEPTSGLDPITAREIEELITRMQKEREITSVVVTHDIHSAQRISNHLALMNEGNILVEGTYADLQKSRDEFVVQFLGDAG